MQRVMVLSMRATIEGTIRGGRRTRFNGASNVVGEFKCMGVAVVLGMNPSHGLHHASLCTPPQHAMYPAPSLHPGVYPNILIKFKINIIIKIYLIL
jgi:hypothetical protein